MGWDAVRRARRRLSREQGTIIKDWGGRLPIALIYPNSYYVGMSCLGVHAIYHLLNSYRTVVCERVFWERENQLPKSPPLSLESQRPLADFAVLAFSLNYEVDYLNVVQLLKASGIPLLTAERSENHPLVIAGGPCITANPLPLAPFFDVLCLGEAEPILPGMVSRLSEGIGEGRDRLLGALASLPGSYLPQFSSDKPPLRQWLKNLDDFPTASIVFTRDTELGDLYLVEVGRGCGWGCPFCLVSSTFSPVRFRSVASLLAQAEHGLRHRQRVGLVGPAVTDHPEIEELLVSLRRMGAGLSVSSMRLKPLSSVVLAMLAEGGAQTISLAPEAGSQRLRRRVKKGISDDDVLEAVTKVSGLGIKQLKLYFMVGLPGETDEDVAEIVRLAARCKGILDRSQSGTRLVLNIAPFVPKAGTPFQRLPMASLAVLNRRLSLLKKGLPLRGIRLKVESPAWSEVQAVLARGDTDVAKVLAGIEEVSLAGWRRAVAECRLDTDFYAHQEWDANQRLPWALVQQGR
jgi:radical SAM superfamily enzyme YgiQ (UPF0313 family)